MCFIYDIQYRDFSTVTTLAIWVNATVPYMHVYFPLHSSSYLTIQQCTLERSLLASMPTFLRKRFVQDKLPLASSSLALSNFGSKDYYNSLQNSCRLLLLAFSDLGPKIIVINGTEQFPSSRSCRILFASCCRIVIY